MKIKNAAGEVVGVVPYGTDLEAFYAAHDLESATHRVELDDRERRLALRSGIYRDVADLESLVGVMADAAAIALHVVAALSRSLETAVDIADVRADLAAFREPLTAYAGRIDDGSIELPYLVKGGLGVVLPEIEQAGTGVATVLAKGQKQP